MIQSPLRNLRYKSCIFEKEGEFTIENSVFIGFHVDGSDTIGSCIVCYHTGATLLIKNSDFYGNSATFTGGAVCVNGCANASIKMSCFSRNYAKFSPDFYIHNKISYINTFTLSEVSSFGSSAASHGIAFGSMKQSLCEYINQSHLMTESTNWAIWVFIYNHISINIKYVYSFENNHHFLFAYDWGAPASSIKVNNFLCIHDNVEELFYSNTALISFSKSSFLLNKQIGLGSSQLPTFESECYSNFPFHDSITKVSEITDFQFNFGRCFIMSECKLGLKSPILKTLLLLLKYS